VWGPGTGRAATNRVFSSTQWLARKKSQEEIGDR